MFRYWSFLVMQFLAERLPLRISYALASAVSFCLYLCVGSDRKSITSNIATITGRSPKEIKPQVRAVFCNFAKYLIDLSRMAKLYDKAWIERNVSIQGLHYLDEASSKGRGALILTAHFGHWELGGAVIARLGYPVQAIALPHPQKHVTDWFIKQRTACGIQTISVQNAIRGSISALRKNKLLAIVADRDFSKTGIRRTFLKRECLIPKGAALFALKTGAAALPSFFYCNDDGKTWTLEVGKPVYPKHVVSGDIHDEDLNEFIDQYIGEFEKMIKQHPGQWLMFREYGKEV